MAPMTKPAQKKIVFGVILFLLLIDLPVIGSWLVYRRIQNRLDLKIQGQFVSRIFVPVFYVRNASFEWNGKVRFEHGDLQVNYRPFSFLSPAGLRIHLSGENLQVRLLGDWAKMEGVENADLEKFDADFSLGRKGLNEIYWVQVESRAFQFHLKKS